MEKQAIIEALETERKLLANYQELSVDIEDDAAYVARGNGFCDAKYSEDFLEGQIALHQERIAALERQLAEMAQ